MRVRWTPTALRDLESLHTYIAEDDAMAADVMVDKIVAAIEGLQRHPAMGRKGRVAGTRELIISPYVVAYWTKNDAIDVVAILHGARCWPDSF